MGLNRSDIHHFTYFLYGEAYYGSYKGMRYRIGAEPLDHLFYKPQDVRDAHQIRAYAWKEPNNFNTAPDKEFADFPFSEEGVVAAVDWLNEYYANICHSE